jgi:hypothetical protein
VPRPVEENRLQVFGTRRGGKLRTSTAAATGATSATSLRRSASSTLGSAGRSSGLGCSPPLAWGTLALSISRLQLAHRDEKSKQTYRERLSITHG